jgi:hypothetical protein
MNVHRVTNFRQPETYTAEPSPEVEIAIAKLKMYKLPGIGKIRSELIQAGGKT